MRERFEFEDKTPWWQSRRFYLTGIIVGVAVLVGAFSYNNLAVLDEEQTRPYGLAEVNGPWAEPEDLPTAGDDYLPDVSDVDAASASEDEVLPEPPQTASVAAEVIAKPEANTPVVFLPPVEGEILRAYGISEDKTFKDYRFHQGIDLAVKRGAPVFAAVGGTVSEIGEDAEMGAYILIEHAGGLVSCYYGVSAAELKLGDAVRGGDLLGKATADIAAEGGQAPHIHFCLTLNGKPVDPAQYM